MYDNLYGTIRNIPDREMICDLRKILDGELEKREAERDYDKIEELCRAIADISEVEAPKPDLEALAAGSKANRKRQRIKRIYCAAAALSACFVIGFALNLYTLSAFGEGLFSTAVKATKNGFSLDFSKDDENDSFRPGHNDTQEGDTRPGSEPTTIPAGTADNGTIGGKMSALCIKNGINDILVPEKNKKLFGGFELKNFETEELEDSQDIYFSFSDEVVTLNITIERYHDEKNIPTELIPSDTYEAYGFEAIDNTHVFCFSDSNSVKAVFKYGLDIYTVCGYNTNEDMIERFISSFRLIESN